MSPVFLSKNEVLALHAERIRHDGGSHGLRDEPLLESALAMPEAGFGDAYLHATLFEMAAAYLFHLARNHPFVDGNKRTALASALVFLDQNGYEVDAPDDTLVELTVEVATGQTGKAEAAAFFQRHATKRA